MVLVGVTSSTITFVFLNPGGPPVDNSVRLITDMMNTLIGLLAGFMVGRTRTVVGHQGRHPRGRLRQRGEYLNTSDTPPATMSVVADVSECHAGPVRPHRHEGATMSEQPELPTSSRRSVTTRAGHRGRRRSTTTSDADPDQEDIGTDDPDATTRTTTRPSSRTPRSTTCPTSVSTTPTRSPSSTSWTEEKI